MQGSKVSSLLCSFRATSMYNLQQPPSVYLEVHQISCLRLVDISSEPWGLSTTTLPDTLLLTGRDVPPHGVHWDRLLLTGNWGFQITSLWNNQVVLSFHWGMAQVCERAASVNDGSQDTSMELIACRLYRQAVSDFMAYAICISCFH